MVFLDFPNLSTAPQQNRKPQPNPVSTRIASQKKGPLPQPNSSSELTLTRPSLASRAAILTLRRECKQSPRSMGRASRDGIGIPSHTDCFIFYSRAQLLKIKAQVSSIWAKGCILMIMCMFYLTWHDYPSLMYWERHGILLLLFLYFRTITIVFPGLQAEDNLVCLAFDSCD